MGSLERKTMLDAKASIKIGRHPIKRSVFMNGAKSRNCPVFLIPMDQYLF